MGGLVIDYRFFGLINVLPFFFCGIVVGFPAKESRSNTLVSNVRVD